jgi:hypothetical protein
MKITKWNYTLNHETYRNEYWVLLDRLELSEALPNWDYLIKFLAPPTKVKNYSKDTDVFDGTNWYNKKDLEEMLNDTIQELNK